MGYKPTTAGTPLERMVGCMAITLLSASYLYACLWLPVAVVIFFWVSKTVGILLLVPYVASAALPPKRFPGLLSTWFFKCALKFHEFEQVSFKKK